MRVHETGVLDMVSMKSVELQLKRLGFNHLTWGRAEVRELPNVLMDGEEIYECVNGIYEGGFALLVATDFRVLLIDKKPLNYLTVEDLRFAMINEIDYNHRLMGAHISISAGAKNLKFTSYNQPRLRKLITHVQDCIAQSKEKDSAHQEAQVQHLEKINQQLQEYLLTQHEYQAKLSDQLLGTRSKKTAKGPKAQSPDLPTQPAVPSPELADYLFAQSLLAKHNLADDQSPRGETALSQALSAEAETIPITRMPESSKAPAGGADANMADLYAEGMQEIFGKHPSQSASPQQATAQTATPVPYNPLEINSLSIAYSKLPMALRNRRFGRPSFHAHSQTEPLVADPNTAIAGAQ